MPEWDHVMDSWHQLITTSNPVSQWTCINAKPTWLRNNGGLGAVPPAGSMEQNPCSGSGAKPRWSWKLFVVRRPKEVTNLAHFWNLYFVVPLLSRKAIFAVNHGRCRKRCEVWNFLPHFGRGLQPRQPSPAYATVSVVTHWLRASVSVTIRVS